MLPEALIFINLVIICSLSGAVLNADETENWILQTSSIIICYIYDIIDASTLCNTKQPKLTTVIVHRSKE